MTTPPFREHPGRPLSTADLAAASREPRRVGTTPNEIERADLEQRSLDPTRRQLEDRGLSASPRGDTGGGAREPYAETAASAPNVEDVRAAEARRSDALDRVEALDRADEVGRSGDPRRPELGDYGDYRDDATPDGTRLRPGADDMRPRMDDTRPRADAVRSDSAPGAPHLGSKAAAGHVSTDAESLEPLFSADQAEGYRNRWTAIQSSFVDDPSAAVRRGDELVAQVMSDLANSFADQRHRFESELGTSWAGNTESLRVALRSYRSFFERLLSL